MPHPAEQYEALLKTLEARFVANMHRHEGLEWSTIQAKLTALPHKLDALMAMENSDGAPDVVSYDADTDEYLFFDCSAQSPEGRRNLCYDQKAQQEREKRGVNPAGNAVAMAAQMGIEILTEAQYRFLQTLGEFDTKTSSWLQTPPKIRKLGGAIFGDRRYDTVFVYHNGAGSFYAARGFRGVLRV